MRQILITVPEGTGQRLTPLVAKYQATNLIQFQARSDERVQEVLIFNVQNHALGDVLTDLGKIDQVQVTLYPQDVYPLPQPNTSVPQQITSVTSRSPLEVWLNGLQSIGSWQGFLGYAVAASIIAWIGLYTNTIYLLIGAMLVAPFAGPAMNFALATASGDANLLKRNLIRYFLSLLLTILVSAALNLVFQQKTATSTMVNVSEISFVAVLLPLTAGAVGAHNLSQSGNNSLVPGTAVGTLVAASLAPPAGLVGMSMAIGRWDLAINGAFLLVLQFVAINLAGAVVFHLYGQTPGSVPLRQSNASLKWISLAASAVVLAGMLTWQFSSSPDFQRSSREQRITASAQQVIQKDARVVLVETNWRFTRPSIDNQDTLLGVVYVEKKPEITDSSAAIEQDLTQSIQRQILEQGFQVKALISVNVLEAP